MSCCASWLHGRCSSGVIASCFGLSTVIIEFGAACTKKPYSLGPIDPSPFHERLRVALRAELKGKLEGSLKDPLNGTHEPRDSKTP